MCDPEGKVAPELNELELICAIFQRAVMDLRSTDEAVRLSARQFLTPSDWARLLAESIGVREEQIKKIGEMVH